MSEHEQRRDEPETEAEETIRDLDVPDDQAKDVAGGMGIKVGELSYKES